MHTKKTILQEAEQIHDGDRENTHGDPAINIARIGKIWTAILGIPVTPEQVCLCMAGLKLARLATNPDHHDSLVDLAGYARLMERVQEAIEGRESIPEPTPKSRTISTQEFMMRDAMSHLHMARHYANGK